MYVYVRGGGVEEAFSLPNGVDRGALRRKKSAGQMFVCLCGGKPLNWVPMGATLLANSQCGLLDVLVKEGFCGIILDVKEDFLC